MTDLSAGYWLFADECTCLDKADARYVGETGRGLARQDDEDRVAKDWMRAVRTIKYEWLPGMTQEERLAWERQQMIDYPTPWNVIDNPGGMDYAQVTLDIATALADGKRFDLNHALARTRRDAGRFARWLDDFQHWAYRATWTTAIALPAIEILGELL